MLSGKKAIKRSVYTRYVLLGAAELVVFVLVLAFVQRWVAFSDGLFWGLVLFWIVKDMVLFPFIWRAYDADASTAAANMIGALGIAKQRLQPRGYVQVRGELWRAVRIGDGPPVEKGRPVRIHQMEGLTLYVTPDGAEEELTADSATIHNAVGDPISPSHVTRP